MKAGKALRAIGFIVLCEFAGIIGSLFTFSSIPAWYDLLQKPWFTPPSWVFGPVWLILYALMGVAAFLVWERKKPKGVINYAKAAFIIQLAFNVCWSILFFGLQSIGKGLFDILLLWITLVATIVLFYKVSRRAALILVPYIIWVSIATALNIYLWKLN